MKIVTQQFPWANTGMVIELAREMFEADIADLNDDAFQFDVRALVIASDRCISRPDFRKNAKQFATSLDCGYKTQVLKVDANTFYIAKFSGWVTATTIEQAETRVEARAQEAFGILVALFHKVAYW